MDRRSGRLQNIFNRIKIRLLSVPRTEMPQLRNGETAIAKGEKRRNARCNGALLLQKGVLYPEALRKYNPIRIFSEEDLRKATNNYDPSRLIRKESIFFFQYFKGNIDDGHVIAVKRPNKIAVKRQCEETLIDSIVTEMVILSGINHKNIAKLLGCCLETERPVLVYEFYSNGPLADNLQKLSWSDRLRIAAEVAEALNYLHTHSSMAIVHRDIRTSNIILDEHCTAKISGSDVLFTITTANMEDILVGTFPYLEPEYANTRVLSEKMDVYSFGVIMLELLIGKNVFQLFFGTIVNEVVVRMTGEEMYRLCKSIGKDMHQLLAQVISSVNFGGSSSSLPAAAPAPETAGIIASRVVAEGRPEQIQAFAQVAMNCLRERGERPTMKEVVLELWRIRSKEEAAVAG